MKKYMSIFLVLIATICMTSCNTGGNSGEEQAGEESQTEAVNEDAVTKSKAKSGSDLILYTLRKLENHLEINEEQRAAISTILTENFANSGYDLADSYNAETGKEMTQKLMKDNKEAIAGILDEAQNVKFEELMNNKRR